MLWSARIEWWSKHKQKVDTIVLLQILFYVELQDGLGILLSGGTSSIILRLNFGNIYI